MADEKVFTKERWTYMGRRVASGGKKLGHEWQTPSGDPVFYDKLQGHVIGGVYELDVSRTDDNIVVKLAVRFTGKADENDVDERTVNKWRADDAAATVEVQQRAIEKKFGGPQLETMTIGQLKRALVRQPSFRRRAVAATVLDMLLGQGGL